MLQASRARVLMVLLVVAVGGLSSAPADAAQRGHPRRHVLVVGAILDLSAGWTSLGQASRVTLRLAAHDANAALARAGSRLRVRLRVADAKGDASRARRALRRMARGGVHVFVGPEGSSEVAAVRRTADRLRVVVISQGSTAHSLALAGDNVLRVVPDDVREGEAVVALLRHDGIDAIVPVWRDDAGNAGLVRSVRRQFAAAGGRVAAGVPYPTDTTDFTAVSAAISRHAATLAQAGAKRIGVYLAGFDEVVALFHAAGESPLLRVPWYGSDGVALSPALLADSSAAEFATTVGYPNPTVGLSAALLKRARPMLARAHRRLGRDPDALALSAYDALRIAVEGVRRTGATRGAALRRGIVSAADGHVGVTGRMTLNRSGDRAYGTFDFWSVCRRGTGYQWRRTFQYMSRHPGSGRLLTLERC